MCCGQDVTTDVTTDITTDICSWAGGNTVGHKWEVFFTMSQFELYCIFIYMWYSEKQAEVHAVYGKQRSRYENRNYPGMLKKAESYE